ncbi:unnamed protein product, partial [Discosporangium mesarthrocarpum]
MDEQRQSGGYAISSFVSSSYQINEESPQWDWSGQYGHAPPGFYRGPASASVSSIAGASSGYSVPCPRGHRSYLSPTDSWRSQPGTWRHSMRDSAYHMAGSMPPETRSLVPVQQYQQGMDSEMDIHSMRYSQQMQGAHASSATGKLRPSHTFIHHPPTQSMNEHVVPTVASLPVAHLVSPSLSSQQGQLEETATGPPWPTRGGEGALLDWKMGRYHPGSKANAHNELGQSSSGEGNHGRGRGGGGAVSAGMSPMSLGGEGEGQ